MHHLRRILTRLVAYAGEVFVHGVKYKGNRSGSGAGGFEDGDVVGVMVGASGRVALYRNGIVRWSAPPVLHPSLPVVPFVSLGASDLSAFLVGEPASIPALPPDWISPPAAVPLRRPVTAAPRSGDLA